MMLAQEFRTLDVNVNNSRPRKLREAPALSEVEGRGTLVLLVSARSEARPPAE
jgi:hypothetical protein